MTTDLFQWKNDFSVGVKILDDQHKGFLEILNRLCEVGRGNRGMEVVGPVLKELVAYSRRHFADEENWLRDKGLPDLTIQESQHEFFIAQVTELQEKYSKGDASIPISTLEFLRGWLLNHILDEDRKYKVFNPEGS